jgi:CheY-like chemotaxis protein
VLLVEDQDLNRLLGKAVLESLGCEVDIACNGLEAVQAARGAPTTWC